MNTFSLSVTIKHKKIYMAIKQVSDSVQISILVSQKENIIMGRFNWSQASAGRANVGTSTGGGFVSRFTHENGDLKRVIIPTVINKETGEEEILILQEPVHNVERGLITLYGSKGNPYTPYQVRCMNPLAQTDRELSKKIAESRQFCALCLMSSLADKEYFAEMDKAFQSVEGYKAASKEEKKAFNSRMQERPKVESSYDARNKKNRYYLDMLVLVLETTTQKVKDEFGIEDDQTTVVMDENGMPKYTPQLFKVSEARLTKFSDAVNVARKSKTLPSNMLHVLNEGGEQVLTAFVDFELTFPQRDTKMKSAAEMSVRAVSAGESSVTPEFVAELRGKSEELGTKAEKAFKSGHSELAEFTTEEYVNAMTDGGERYNELKKNFLDANDKVFIDKVFRTAQGEQGLFSKDSSTSSADIKKESATPANASATTAEPKKVATLDSKDDLLNID